MSMKDRFEIVQLINEWNSTRLDLFKISEPNEALDFYGVMRFYFQDAEDKVTTKCIRVASSATTVDVVKVLIEKLRPDMKTLPNENDYCIYEVHPNGEERKLNSDDRPLCVQLTWGKDQREGRFVLQNAKIGQKSKPAGGSFKERRSSKRDSKKKSKTKTDASDETAPLASVAESLYKSVPETNKFTRSLSNPEMVKKIQQDRLKQKFLKISTKEGGGTMKVFGDALNPSIPYKTFLLSIKDTAEWLVKEMLEKYGMRNEDPENYCLLQIVVPPRDQIDNKTVEEVILHDKECPLNICLNHAQKSEGSIMFKVIKCPPEFVNIRKKMRGQETFDAQSSLHDRTINDQLPFFIEINTDGTDVNTPRVFKIAPNTTHVGRDSKTNVGKQYFYIDGVGIDRDHCTIHNQNGTVTLAPKGEIWLNGKLINQPFALQHGCMICFGRAAAFRYFDPAFVYKSNMRTTTNASQQQRNFVASQTTEKHVNHPHHFGHTKSAVVDPMHMDISTPLHGSMSAISAVVQQPQHTQSQQIYSVKSQHMQNQYPKDTLALKKNTIDALRTKELKKSSHSSTTNVVDGGHLIDVLPGLLEVPIETETRFLHSIFENRNLLNIGFRLSPVYCLYMSLRHRLSPYGSKTNIPVNHKQDSIVSLLYKIENMISRKIEECREHGGYLAFWIANTSELLNFIKQDRDLSRLSNDVQDRLAECVQRLFRHLTTLVQTELEKYLCAFSNPQDDVERDVYIAFGKVIDFTFIFVKHSVIYIVLEDSSANNPELSDSRWMVEMNDNVAEHPISLATLGDILATLSSVMDLLRKCRVNAALTIQMFSLIFHYINCWLFNRIVCYSELKLCTHYWGEKLSSRLSHISDWALRQGLELASDCHLTKVNQLCQLLQNSKRDQNDASLLANVSLKLNSKQIKQVLDNYIRNRNEPQISTSFTQAVLSAARKFVDDTLCREGVPIHLHEDPKLNLPFLLPEDGYTCDTIRSIPQPLFEFIEPMSRDGICRLFTNPHSFGLWTEFMKPLPVHNDDEYLPQSHHLRSMNGNGQVQYDNSTIQTIMMNKKNNSLGLSIVAAKGENQQFQGIYIKAIVPGGAAEEDSRLQAGDQIIQVDNVLLIDVTQDQAADALKQCGPTVTLKVLKDAAYHQGLSALLTKSVPDNHQAGTRFSTTTTPPNQRATLSVVPSILKATSSHERLLVDNNHYPHPFATPDHHMMNTLQPTVRSSSTNALLNQMANSSSTVQHQLQPPIRPQQNNSYEYVYNAKSLNQPPPQQQGYNNHQRSIQAARSVQALIDEDENQDNIMSHQRHSNPNLDIEYKTLFNKNQTFDIPKSEQQPEDEEESDEEEQPAVGAFVRLASERQSFGENTKETFNNHRYPFRQYEDDDEDDNYNSFKHQPLHVNAHHMPKSNQYTQDNGQQHQQQISPLTNGMRHSKVVPIINHHSNVPATANQRPTLAPKPNTKTTNVPTIKLSNSVSDVDVAGKQSKTTLSTSSDQLACLTNHSNYNNNNNTKYDSEWKGPVNNSDQTFFQHPSSRNSTNTRFALHDDHQSVQNQHISAPLSLSPLLSLTQTKSKSNLTNNTHGNSHRQKITEYRLNRINDLQNKHDRTEQEDKELSNLKLESEFDRRVEEFHFHGDSDEEFDYASQAVLSNPNTNDGHYIPSIKPFVSTSILPQTPLNTNQTGKLSMTNEMNEFDEKLKRRLEQFEQERQVQRQIMTKLQERKEADIEAHLRRDRDRQVRVDRDMRDLKLKRMSEEERSLEAKKEQARLSKHVRLPGSPPSLHDHEPAMKHSTSANNISHTAGSASPYITTTSSVKTNDSLATVVNRAQYQMDQQQKPLTNKISTEKLAISPSPPPPPPTRDVSFAVASNLKNTFLQRSSTQLSSAQYLQNGRDHPLHCELSPPMPPPPPHISDQSLQQMTIDNHVVEIPVSSLDAVEHITAELVRRDNLFNYDSTTNIPSVIGAQEYYIDPRTRAKKEKQSLVQDNKENVNETMTFTQKLKFFTQTKQNQNEDGN
ncbi:unnamed protein product [Didymodactylos carnosus]|uniref:Afadin n=1 Tax=Didymodactylos carnosus TaxID=1234261 RepID=A0A813S2X7_9BILA|nr:unnamed protein product [Didymodactylos carnosus]CAF0821344.1 unnamed protein product [Didymodactylos carnosus]CAF3575655.1 unnamed protein product [Didymodactylos carnosus]CAF3605656.1 unnamed protein product [Didymodactylos carnosus]